MSTTTELRTLCSVATAALATWFVGLALAAYFIEPTRDVIVFAPQERLGTLLSGAPVAILDAPRGFLRIRGLSRGFVRVLYAQGAWIVLPATRGGCRGGFGRIPRTAPPMRNAA